MTTRKKRDKVKRSLEISPAEDAGLVEIRNQMQSEAKMGKLVTVSEALRACLRHEIKRRKITL